MMTKSDQREPAIRRRIDALAKAIRARDLDRVMSFYAAEIVSFDLDAPLRYMGTVNKRRAWAEFFAAHPGDLDYDFNEISISSEGEVASVRSLNRVRSTSPDGHHSEMWVRWTACFRRFKGVWLVVHDHVSVPPELPYGRAAPGLWPQPAL
jgi:ketosteroid isomerase-like protein